MGALVRRAIPKVVPKPAPIAPASIAPRPPLRKPGIDFPNPETGKYLPGYHPNTKAKRGAPWKPGQPSANPKGRPVGSGKGSIVKYLKARLKEASSDPVKYACLADQIGEMLIKLAKKKDFRALEMLLNHTESKQITEQDMHDQIEKVFNVVCKHVKDREALTKIAKELKLGEEI